MRKPLDFKGRVLRACAGRHQLIYCRPAHPTIHQYLYGVWCNNTRSVRLLCALCHSSVECNSG